MQIGLFDSGIGGLTVLYEAQKLLPNEDYIYYADTVNVPYGEKTKAEVAGLVFDAVTFIIKQGVKAVVIACNTATSAAVEPLRARYDLPIIGMEPAVKPAVKIGRNANKRVLVTATPMTLREEKLHNLIERSDSSDIVDLLPLPGLVRFAEKLDFNSAAVISYLQEQLKPYDLDAYEAVVLGCTHFIYYKDVLKKLLPSGVELIDGNQGTVRQLKRVLNEKSLLCSNTKAGSVTYYNSGIIAGEDDLLKYNRLLSQIERLN
jgi:glutamate racemase